MQVMSEQASLTIPTDLRPPSSQPWIDSISIDEPLRAESNVSVVELSGAVCLKSTSVQHTLLPLAKGSGIPSYLRFSIPSIPGAFSLWYSSLFSFSCRTTGSFVYSYQLRSSGWPPFSSQKLPELRSHQNQSDRRSAKSCSHRQLATHGIDSRLMALAASAAETIFPPSVIDGANTRSRFSPPWTKVASLSHHEAIQAVYLSDPSNLMYVTSDIKSSAPCPDRRKRHITGGNTTHWINAIRLNGFAHANGNC